MFGLLASIHQVITFLALGGGGGSGGGGGGGSSSSSSSSSSGGGDGSGDPLGIIIFVAVIIFFVFIVASSAKAVAKRRAKMKADLAIAASKDKIWEQGSLETRSKDNFIQFQKDWSSFNLDSMKTYMTPEYYQHNLLMMGALKVANRQNDVQNIAVHTVDIVTMGDEVNDAQDAFTAQIAVSATDILNDSKDKTQLFSRPVTVTEFHKFKREDNKWLFAGIDQATANPMMRNNALQKFSDDNGYFYSLDWGHLLLPRRGQLFAKGSFGVSDINNHVIGLYNDIIIQLYTYVANPARSTKSYLIAQTSLPKSYGNIVVRRRAGLFQSGIKGLRRIKMEWLDFNKKYEVYASDQELATSFELLNPKFMEQLEALPFEVNIEVVDSIVYLYSPENGVVSPEHYATMLEVLKAAFKEMKL